jgi:molybdopterin-guanine dinucleotide biosynthesis protein A
MLLDAIVLAGGRSSRLSGVPKSLLLWRGSTLLQNTVDAVLEAGASRVVVVGPGGRDSDAPGPDAPGSDARIRFAREDPPFGGPAAAVAAGMRALESQSDAAGDLVLVLACDMPQIASAVPELVASGSLPGRDGALLLDSSGTRQPLAAIYGRRALADAIDGLRASGAVEGASMRSLISSLELVELADDRGATRDIDTWNDAAAFGIDPPDDALIASEALPTSRKGADHE